MSSSHATPRGQSDIPLCVYVDMVADLFHAGHVAFLRQARALAAVLHPDRKVTLVVGIHSDATAREYKRVPVCTMEERMAVVGAMDSVLKVIADAPLHLSQDYLDTHKIDLVVHGDDLSETSKHMWYGCAVERGIFHTVPYTGGISTTEILDRIEIQKRTSVK